MERRKCQSEGRKCRDKVYFSNCMEINWTFYSEYLRELLVAAKSKLDFCENQLAVTKVKLTNTVAKCSQLEAGLSAKQK